MQSYREGFVHLLYAIVLTQFVFIAVLLGGYSNQYIADDYFRAWVNSNYPWMGSLLQGQVDALLVGMALAATVLIIQHMRRGEELRSVIMPFPSQETISSIGSDKSNRSAPKTEGPRAGPQMEGPADILAELEKGD